MDQLSRPDGGKTAAGFVFLLAAAAAAVALLYCAAVWLLHRAGLGWSAYAAALPVPAAAGAAAALCLVRRARRRLARLRQAFQDMTGGDLSVRLPQEDAGGLSGLYGDFNRMAQELQRVRSMRDEYVNTFTHEFKTPLTAIRGFAELLQEPGFTEEEQKKYLHIIASETCQLAELANDALLLTKLETQNLPVVRKNFWLDEQISQSLTLLEGSAREKGQTLTAQLEPVEVCGSEELLSHVWTNLISNAVKYTPNGGSISVSLRQEDGKAVFAVTDSGIGMTEEVRQHIFDRYYQADPSRTRKGIGLGLPIVRRILDLCGGRIEVESAPGQGSTFRVTLPQGLSCTEA